MYLSVCQLPSHLNGRIGQRESIARPSLIGRPASFLKVPFPSSPLMWSAGGSTVAITGIKVAGAGMRLWLKRLPWQSDGWDEVLSGSDLFRPRMVGGSDCESDLQKGVADFA